MFVSFSCLDPDWLMYSVGSPPPTLCKQDIEAGEGGGGGGGGATVTLPFGADASGEVGYIVSVPGEVCSRCHGVTANYGFDVLEEALASRPLNFLVYVGQLHPTWGSYYKNLGETLEPCDRRGLFFPTEELILGG